MSGGLIAGTCAEIRRFCINAPRSKVALLLVSKSRTCASTSAVKFEKHAPAERVTASYQRASEDYQRQRKTMHTAHAMLLRSRTTRASFAIYSAAMQQFVRLGLATRLTCKISARQPSRTAAGSSFLFWIAAARLRLLLGRDSIFRFRVAAVTIVTGFCGFSVHSRAAFVFSGYIVAQEAPHLQHQRSAH